MIGNKSQYQYMSYFVVRDIHYIKKRHAKWRAATMRTAIFFLQRKIGASKAYSDVERVNNLDIFAPQAHTRKRLIARRRRDARVYKGIATASVTFCERGAATEHMKKSHSFE